MDNDTQLRLKALELAIKMDPGPVLIADPDASSILVLETASRFYDFLQGSERKPEPVQTEEARAEAPTNVTLYSGHDGGSGYLVQDGTGAEVFRSVISGEPDRYTPVANPDWREHGRVREIRRERVDPEVFTSIFNATVFETRDRDGRQWLLEDETERTVFRDAEGNYEVSVYDASDLWRLSRESVYPKDPIDTGRTYVNPVHFENYDQDW